MATGLKELIVTFEANARPVIDALNRVESKLKQTSARMKKTSDDMIRVGRNFGLALSVPLGLVSLKALKASADFEVLNLQMEVLTGSAEEGTRVFKRLVEFSSATPFQLDELAKATVALIGFGETADDAHKHLKLLGDVAAVSGGDFNGIVQAFGQASAEVMDENMSDDLFAKIRGSFEESLASSSEWLEKSDGYYTKQRNRVLNKG